MHFMGLADVKFSLRFAFAVKFDGSANSALAPIDFTKLKAF